MLIVKRFNCDFMETKALDFFWVEFLRHGAMYMGVFINTFGCDVAYNCLPNQAFINHKNGAKCCQTVRECDGGVT